MKDSLISYFRRKLVGDISKEEIQTIHQIARNRFGNDFPNPSREGCPPEELFQKMIGKKTLPGEDLRKHLFSCSECFSEYRELMEQSRQTETANKIAAFFSPLKPVLAPSLFLFLIAFGIWLWHDDSNSSELALTNSPATNQNYENSKEEHFSTSAVAENTQTNSTSAVENSKLKPNEVNKNTGYQTKQTNNDKNEKHTPVKESEPRFLAKNEVEIDLNNQAIWRSSSDTANQKAFQLNPVETSLRIKLPKENPSGVYQVFIVDEFGKTLTEKKTVRARNQNLSVQINLRKITGNQKRLCFAPVSEIPDCVLINIAAKKE